MKSYVLLMFLAGVMGPSSASWIPRVSTPNTIKTTSWAARWLHEAPSPYNQQFSLFFSKTPTPRIYRNTLKTLRRLLRSMQGQPLAIKLIQNAFRDHHYNRRIGGARHSLHIQGKAIDFVPTMDLRYVRPGVMERMGRALNRQGLQVIWYPFRKHDRSIHVQLDPMARRHRRIFYRGRQERGYHTSYWAARYAKSRRSRD